MNNELYKKADELLNNDWGRDTDISMPLGLYGDEDNG
jgi:hypothetical protein